MAKSTSAQGNVTGNAHTCKKIIVNVYHNFYYFATTTLQVTKKNKRVSFQGDWAGF